MIYFDKKLSLFSFTLRTAEEIIIVNQMHKKKQKNNKNAKHKYKNCVCKLQIIY